MQSAFNRFSLSTENLETDKYSFNFFKSDNKIVDYDSILITNKKRGEYVGRIFKLNDEYSLYGKTVTQVAEVNEALIDLHDVSELRLPQEYKDAINSIYVNETQSGNMFAHIIEDIENGVYEVVLEEGKAIAYIAVEDWDTGEKDFITLNASRDSIYSMQATIEDCYRHMSLTRP